MRRILVDHARRHGARKRGDGVPCVSIDEARSRRRRDDTRSLALDQCARIAWQRSTLNSPGSSSCARFGGLTIDEAAHVLKRLAIDRQAATGAPQGVSDS